MRIVTNTPLVKRNRQWAQYLFFISFGLLIVGLLASNRPVDPNAEQNFLVSVVFPTLVLPVAFVATMLSVRMTNLWARVPRPEVAIPEGLKGISPKSVLFSYFHFPARHVLITPNGVYAIVTRFQDGQIENTGSTWKQKRGLGGRILGIFRFDALGSPSDDALRAAQHVKGLLQPIAGDVNVQPLVVFVDPRADLTIADPAVPVLHANPKHPLSLKDFVVQKGKEKQQVLTPQQIEAFEQATTAK